jgi:hypothetical protein
MSEKAYLAAMQLLRDARYLEFKDDYDGDDDCKIWATDGWGTTIAVADALHSKTIRHYSGCEGFEGQERLSQLEDDLIKILHIRVFSG